MRTLPNTRFIVSASTQSQQTLTTVPPQQAVELCREDSRNYVRQAVYATFGEKAGDVFSTVMGAEERPSDNNFVRALGVHTRLVSDGQGESKTAKTLRREPERLSPHDPALDRADIQIRRQRVM